MNENDNIEESLPLLRNFFGSLRTDLEDLKGYSTLANELIQNADDAQATSITFDVTNKELLVENDSTFTECETVSAIKCSKKSGNLCDFHRFRDIANGDKRKNSENIGAFGIGFTSVYQITDCPEVISGKRHWVINLKNQEINPKKHNQINKTRFILPWANEKSELRSLLEVEVITKEHIDALFKEISDAISKTIIFLKNIKNIELKKNGILSKSICLEWKREILTISVDNEPKDWILIQGGFSEEKKSIEQFPESERNRKPEVAMAIPINDDCEGMLFAYLPTKIKTGFPFHLNANFFPSPDRKKILFSNDPKSEWNKLAVKKSAELLAQNLCSLTKKLGQEKFWQLISSFKEIADSHDRNKIEIVFDEFWQQAIKVLPTFPSVYSSSDKWEHLSECFLFKNYEKEKPAIPILEEIGIKIVHENLTKYRKLLTELSVETFDLVTLSEGLNNQGLSGSIPFSEAPLWLQNEKNRKVLADEIKYLLKPSQNDDEGRSQIKKCSIAKSCANTFIEPNSIYKIDENDRELFLPLGLAEYFIADDNPEVITGLVEDFTIEKAIELLKEKNVGVFSRFFSENKKDFIKLVKWLVDSCQEASEETKSELRKLQIWISRGELCVLDDYLVVPSDFDDPWLLANTLDKQILKIGKKKLINIGAEELTLKTYITNHIDIAPNMPRDNKAVICRGLIKMFADKFSEIKDDESLRKKIASFPIVECNDKEFRPSVDVYFSNDLTEKFLNPTASFIKKPSSKLFQELFDWLEIADKPRIKDLLELIDVSVSRGYPSNKDRKFVKDIYIHLGERYEEIEDSQRLEILKILKWLPITEDKLNWYSPKEVFSPEKKYLFETQGKFLNLTQDEVRKIRKFNDYLGVDTDPSVKLVVDHLLKMMRDKKPVNKRLYSFLESNAEAEANEITKLRNQDCILLPDNRYVSPNKIFLSPHNFGSYRTEYKLESEQQYENLFRVLGVKKEPNENDAIAVLKEISEKFCDEILEENDQEIVRSCWKFLSNILKKKDIPEKLAELKTIPVMLTNSGRMEKPSNLYFNDFPHAKETLELQHLALKLPDEYWQPLEQAGVQFLSKVVKVEFVKKQGESIDSKRSEKLIERLECIRIIVTEEQKNRDFDCNIDSLKTLKFVSVNDLQVKYSIPETKYISEVVSISTLFRQEEQTIYFNRVASEREIAKEITHSIGPNTDLKSLVANIENILEARTIKEANSILIESGYPEIDFRKVEIPNQSKISELGGLDEFTDEEYENKNDNELDEVNNIHDQHNELNRKEHSNDVEKDINPIQLPQSWDSSDNSVSEKEQNSLGASDKGENDNSIKQRTSYDYGHTPSKRSKANRKGKQSRLRSYVETDENRVPKAENPEITIQRKQTDKSGIFAVLEFEKEHGRIPEEENHNNPGYDILSFDEKREYAIETVDNEGGKRFIEVKSTKDYWGERGVYLTNTQFERAQEEEEWYWLYVVERAGKSDEKIYTINNPAKRISQFFFDDGWKQVSEEK